MKLTAHRQEILQTLRQESEFDLVIIGGGASGCGIALDAASRGLKVALFDKHDLAEGTSSRSTKLVHGGVRYLEAAVKKLDKDQYNLVKEALSERGTFLKNARHLAYPRALVTPIYKWHEVPYVYAGLLMYDLLAGKKGLGHSVVVSRKEALKRFPMLKAEGLKAGVIYYDGQFNDARMAVGLAATAKKHSALIANHMAVTGLEKTDGRISAVTVCDAITKERFTVKTKGVINATGPFVDHIRKMDEPSVEPIVEAASGIHIILPKHIVPPETGMLIPKTEDGRVLFILPWQGQALVGTTDNPSEIVDHPRAEESEIEYILRHINQYFDVNISRSDVTAVWSGLRPLVKLKETENTAQIVREHAILRSASGLLTIAGGKWTSYRKMAEETVDEAISLFKLSIEKNCQTMNLPILGAEHFTPAAGAAIAKEYALEPDIAEHLNHAYGDQAREVLKLGQSTGLLKRLHSKHPFIEAEVIYAVRKEFAERAFDVLTRRMSMALLDTQAAIESLERVIQLLALECEWDQVRCDEEKAIALGRFNTSI